MTPLSTPTEFDQKLFETFCTIMFTNTDANATKNSRQM